MAPNTPVLFIPCTDISVDKKYDRELEKVVTKMANEAGIEFQTIRCINDIDRAVFQQWGAGLGRRYGLRSVEAVEDYFTRLKEYKNKQTSD